MEAENDKEEKKNWRRTKSFERFYKPGSLRRNLKITLSLAVISSMMIRKYLNNYQMRNFYAKIHKKLMTRKNVFPQIPVRTGYRTISTNIMETLVVMESDSKIERRKCAKIFQFIGNTLFGRKWSLSTDNDEEEEDEVW